MSIALEAYTAEGVLTGAVVADGRLVDLLATFESIIVERAVLTPFGGPPQRADGWSTVEVDDLLAVVATADTVTPFHAVWHPVSVDVGPYRITGELPALPGFDPARALARPTGSFVLVGRTNVELLAEGSVRDRHAHAYLWINRYTVDAVRSQLELGFFFPGATETRAPHAVAS